MEISRKIQSFVAANKLEEALDLLKELDGSNKLGQENLIILKIRTYNEIKELESSGTESRDYLTIQKNKLTRDVLTILENMKKRLEASHSQEQIPINLQQNISFSVIGTPNGLQLLASGFLKYIDFRNFVDLNPLYINVYPNTEIGFINKVQEDGNFYTYYVLYRYAKEYRRNRAGGFYGSVIALKNCKIMKEKESLFIDGLFELANYLKDMLIDKDNRFRETDFRNLSIDNLVNKYLDCFKICTLTHNDKKYFENNSKKCLLFSNENFIKLFTKALKDTNENSIYITSSLQVKNFVEKTETFLVKEWQGTNSPQNMQELIMEKVLDLDQIDILKQQIELYNSMLERYKQEYDKYNKEYNTIYSNLLSLKDNRNMNLVENTRLEDLIHNFKKLEFIEPQIIDINPKDEMIFEKIEEQSNKINRNIKEHQLNIQHYQALANEYISGVKIISIIQDKADNKGENYTIYKMQIFIIISIIVIAVALYLYLT